jgi:hypothetical protein
VNHLGIKFETRRIGAYEIGFNYGDGPGTKHDILGALGATLHIILKKSLNYLLISEMLMD